MDKILIELFSLKDHSESKFLNDLKCNKLTDLFFSFN